MIDRFGDLLGKEVHGATAHRDTQIERYLYRRVDLRLLIQSAPPHEDKGSFPSSDDARNRLNES